VVFNKLFFNRKLVIIVSVNLIKGFLMNTVSKFKVFIARLVDYAACLLLLSGIEDQTSLYLSPLLLVVLAPIFMMISGTILCRYWGTTLGFKLLGLKPAPITSLKEAFLSSFLVHKSDKVTLKKQISKWRYAVAALLGLSCLFLQLNDPVYGFSARGSITDTSWVQYTHREAGFSVYFPDEPEETKKPLTPSGDTGLNYTEMSAEQKKGIYSLSYIKLPKKWGLAGQNTILKVSLDLIIKHTPGASLVKREMTQYQGIKAIDYTLLVDGQEVVGRILLHDNILYKLNVQYPKGGSGRVVVADFFNSFAIG